MIWLHKSANMKLSGHVTDTRVYRGCDVHSDHYMLLSEINIPPKRVETSKKGNLEHKHCFKVHLLCQESIRRLYF
jgi:hypothetical protein